jgi:ABC-type sugar transport system ATPase subunit
LTEGTINGTPAGVLTGIVKTFGGVQALRGIDLVVEPGQVHALVGENGAGKSTCLGVLAGRVVPDSGTLELFGQQAALGSPKSSRKAGVASIYQELTIVPELSTQANVFLGSERSRAGWLSSRAMKREYGRLCERLGVDIPTDVEAGELSVADQQLLELMRGLATEPRMILFDEPTAALAPREREGLYGIIRGLRADGVAVVFVSHNLDEVLGLSDRVTVFRDGAVVSSGPVDAWSKGKLVAAMLGHPAEEGALSLPDMDLPPPDPDGGEVRMQVAGLEVGHSLRHLDLTVQRGELLGIAGLVGSGRSTSLRAIAGAVRAANGTMELDGVAVAWPASVRASQRRGIFMIPEDRRRSGLMMEMSGVDNILVSNLNGVARLGIVDRGAARRRAAEAAEAVGFRVERLNDPVGNLSGGNQQKILLARAVYRNPKVLLADEPTRGVDVGAKAEIAASLRRLAADGMSVVVVSSEFEELEELCDRVVVLSRGEVVETVTGDDITVQRMLNLAFQHPHDPVA